MVHEQEFEGNLFIKYKKYKTTHQSSTRFCRKIEEIKNEIPYHHDDDDLYAQDITINERVHDYCLAEIFMYLPACERPKIALVCKQWKRVLDYFSWFDVKKLKLIHWEFDEYPNLLIKNYPTIDGQFSFLKSLLTNCGRYLQELDLTAYDHCNILPVINECCPNLVKLRIRIKYLDDAIVDNAFTRLSKLKVLKIIFQCFSYARDLIPVTLLNSLLNVANTLIELNLSVWTKYTTDEIKFPDEFIRVISGLVALKTLDCGRIFCSRRVFDYLMLKTDQIMIRSDKTKYPKNEMNLLFKDQEKLELFNVHVTDDFLYNVVNQMRQLKLLHICCDRVTDAGMVAVSKMRNLSCFTCMGFSNIIDTPIMLFKNMLLMSLPFSKKITDKSATEVLKNSPEMKLFCVIETGVTFEFIKTAEEISRKRKKDLTIMISRKDDEHISQIKYEYLTVKYIERKKRPKVS